MVKIFLLRLFYDSSLFGLTIGAECLKKHSTIDEVYLIRFYSKKPIDIVILSFLLIPEQINILSN
jgi:hypothetical protein